MNVSQLFFPSFDGHSEGLALGQSAVDPSFGRIACVRRALSKGPQSVGEALPAVFEEQKDQGEQQEQLPHRAEEEDVEVESLQNKDDQKSRSNERDETG